VIVRRAGLAALVALALATPPAGAQPFDWDALGAEFCARTTAGDLPAMRPLISASLAREIEVAFGRAGQSPPPTLFQTYGNRVSECTARTRNAAIIEIRRSGPGGAAPAWTEYAVVVPEADGTSRIDDVLFATRRSDTLRARLGALGR
jgi:hypothetical protein